MAQRRAWPIGQCRVCLGWGEKPQYADCGACSPWRRLHPEQAPCRRCGHRSHVNTDGLCRLCLQVIRTFDADWIADPIAGQPCQLALILPGVHLPRSQPIDRPLKGRPRDASRPRSWLDRQRIASAEPSDDPRVCPPVVRGQLLLFRPRRQLTQTHVRRIRDRDLADYDRLRSAAIAKATKEGLSTMWWRAACWMLRLALAVRDADGEDLVAEEVLDDLPRSQSAVTDILREAGQLRPRLRRRPVVPPKPHCSCRHCDCWGFRSICSGCSSWGKHPVGDCRRCERRGVLLLDAICRACCLHIDHHGPQAREETWTQLWFGGDLAPRLAIRPGALGYDAPHHKARQRAAATRPPAPVLSPHLINPAQTVLFDVRRDWTCIAVGELDRLPSLTPAAEALLDDFRHHAKQQGWDEQVRRLAARSLRILLARVGADTPIHEADIRSLPTDRPGTSARRILQFLTRRGLVIPDPARLADIHEQAVDQRIRTFPDTIADELRRWVRVLRGDGRREHPAMPFETIRKYLGYLRPVLTAWTDRVTSLREITKDDVRDALTQRPGSTGRDLLSALRSLFQALKQERVIFRDPTRSVSLPAIERLPVPIPTDRLRGLVDRADTPMAKFVVALIAIHGLGRRETRHVLLADLDSSRGRLTVRRDLRRTVYLDELTHSLATDWLRDRYRRWPLTANPYLLVSQQTAADDRLPPVSTMVMNEIFRPLGLSPSKLRQDRILDEARHTADPVHLMRVFGIAAETAMKYIYAAHPERQSTLWR
ncbi:site-specific integrase [Streptomyces lutosisoli]|uniref:Tyrosine recombinase XerC n=1 Tax=Streptomyces lutosisoli TaxID=2665721 RepID=A0ABW2VSH0_9ACTN